MAEEEAVADTATVVRDTMIESTVTNDVACWFPTPVLVYYRCSQAIQYCMRKISTEDLKEQERH